MNQPGMTRVMRKTMKTDSFTVETKINKMLPCKILLGNILFIGIGI